MKELGQASRNLTS